MCDVCIVCFFFGCKQKTAYEMRISYWSSDVCSSDLQGFGAQCFFQLWSSEMFPTLLRSTAQGVMFAVVRIALGIFSFFVPWLTATGFQTLAWILVGFLAISGLIGFIWAPQIGRANV